MKTNKKNTLGKTNQWNINFVYWYLYICTDLKIYRIMCNTDLFHCNVGRIDNK